MQEPHDIIFKNVSFAFTDEVVLNNLSFTAKACQHTVIKGESGSGKSTILKLLLGFHTPASGTISLTKNSSMQQVRKRTAWLPQDLDLGDESVNNVIDKPFRFSINQNNKPSFSKKSSVLRQLGLRQETLQKPFRALSTGQRQRVGLGICYLLDKPMLLLDEPTSALDHKSKERVAKLFLNKKLTILSTSHDPFWVQRADNVIEL